MLASMEFKGYKIFEKKDTVIVEGIRDFNLRHTFECGQCFRWQREWDGSYTGVARERVINVDMQEDTLYIRNTSVEDFQNIWYNYFDLGRDYSLIKHQVAQDEVMEQAVAFGNGIRLLRQDLWETIISFILSSNNRIPRIMKIISAISQMYGKELHMGDTCYYTFPGTARLCSASVEELDACRGGYRCKYIVNTSRMIQEGMVLPEQLAGMPAQAARNELMKLEGVGPKVADCILLYSGTRYDVFPTDVWVKRVMEALYFHQETPAAEIQAYVADKFGHLAGFAQQYLFYYAREMRIGT